MELPRRGEYAARRARPAAADRRAAPSVGQAWAARSARRREARRLLRPDGVVLVAFQAGRGTHDVPGGFRALGHDVALTRFHRTADDVARLLAPAGLAERARLVRRPVSELDDQTLLLVRKSAG